jgi:hypothetical protein
MHFGHTVATSRGWYPTGDNGCYRGKDACGCSNVHIWDSTWGIASIAFRSIIVEQHQQGLKGSPVCAVGLCGFAGCRPVLKDEANRMVTINDTREQFVAEVGGGNPKSASSPQSIITIFREGLNSHAHQDLSTFEQARFDKEYTEDHRYCDIFGPRRIDPSHINHFLNFFAVRHGQGTKEFLKACGPLMEKLATWLLEKGHWTPGQMAYFRELVGDKAGSDLAACEEFRLQLSAYVGSHPVDAPEDIPDNDYLEDDFTIRKVEAGKLRLASFDQGEIVITLPKKITDKAKAGWSVLLEIARIRGTWRILNVGNVYPL